MVPWNADNHSEAQQPEYELYRRRRQLWIECLNSDDQHGVWRRIWDANFMTSCYEMARSAVALSPTNEQGHEFNGPLWVMIHQCFFEAQMSRVRSLTDDGYALDGPKGVYSLGALLRDIESNAALVTRGHAHRFDRDSGRRDWWIDEVQTFYDRACNTTPDSRSPDDRFPVELIHLLQDRMKSASCSIVEFATKHIAHTASPESRARIEDVEVTLEGLFIAQRTIAEVADFVSLWIADGSSHLSAGTADNQYEYLDRPWILSDDDLDGVRQAVKRYGEKVNHSHWGLDEAFADYRRSLGAADELQTPAPQD